MHSHDVRKGTRGGNRTLKYYSTVPVFNLEQEYNIQRREFLKNSGLGAIALALIGVTYQCRNRPELPNFVFILVDDLGWKDVGFMGSQFHETPQIDQLAREGIYFTNAYTNAPNCAPTRACLLSGQYMSRHGIYTVGNSERGNPKFRKLIPTPNQTVMNPANLTLAEALKMRGYATASIGKWHLGTDPESGPLVQGFDLNLAGNQAGAPRTYFSPYRNKNLTDGPEDEYLTDRLTSEALRFIDANHHRPFFLYLPHFAVHTPIQAQPKLIEKYKNKPATNGQNHPEYAAMVESVDASVGRILDQLTEHHLNEKTLVIFFSDNGGHGNFTSMQPLRGSKGQLYEGGIRVPCIFRWTGTIQPGQVCHTPIIGLDFFPTLLESADISIPEDKILDGVSLLPLIKSGASLEREALYWHFPAYLEPYNASQLPWRITPAGAVRKGDWKLLEFFEDGRLELYNLKTDIGETKNLLNENPEKAQELYALMKNWRQELQAPVPIELNPLYDASAEPTLENNR